MSENLVTYNKKYYQILPMNFRLIQKFVHRTIDWCFKQRFARDRIEEGNWLSSIGNNLSNIFLKTSATLKVSTHFFHTQYESRKKGRREEGKELVGVSIYAYICSHTKSTYLTYLQILCCKS